MADEDLNVQIKDLKAVIQMEQENYKAALQSLMQFDSLKAMRLNIKKLKADLQILLDKQSVNRTGELPKGDVS